MFIFDIGDRVTLAFNAMPDEEKERLEKAVSHTGIAGKRPDGLKSKVVQAMHQTVAQTGTVLERRGTAEGITYLVKVDVDKLPQGRQRVVPEEKLTPLG